jgi:hypothetical protein
VQSHESRAGSVTSSGSAAREREERRAGPPHTSQDAGRKQRNELVVRCSKMPVIWEEEGRGRDTGLG